ncbi:hypothetical protein SCUCBS95973_002275 [Sporothrix curviconia]|uniref:Inosine/uridine-preferring nucleoside hydrolase domain-containing protein n=1 Tax=Sporothrix curviconia TaxID=1260050 RepID=A0ABP0B5Q7_9PEZI
MALLSFLALAASVLAGTVVASCPKPLIIDSDFGSFDDDPLALGLANIFQLWGEAEILAVVISTDYELAAPAVDAIDTFYGHPDIPIGANKPLSNATQTAEYATEYGDYITGLTYDWPEDVRTGYNTTTPLDLYRKYLSEAADKSVTIVLIGNTINLYALMESPADSYSPLNGTELIRAKVAELAVQAAAYGKSYNLYSDEPLDAEFVVDNWPAGVPLTYIGSNIGGNVLFGARLTTELNLTANPVAYTFNHSVGYNVSYKTWDATAMYYAVRGLDDVYAYNFTGGHDVADANATTHWVTCGYNSSENAVVFADNGIGNATFAARLEDILLWQPGDAIPASLTKMAQCTATAASSGVASTTGASATATTSVVPVSSAVKATALSGIKLLPVVAASFVLFY